MFRMSIYDNARNIGEDVIKEIEREHTDGYAERFIYGRFASVGSGYLKFDSTIHVVSNSVVDGEEWLGDESGNRIIPIDAIDAYSFGHDFGWTSPAAQVVVAWDKDGGAYALDEYYKAQSTKEELLENALRLQGLYGVGVWYCDPSEPETINYLRDRVSVKKNESRREDGVRELGSRFKKQGDDRCRLYIHSRCRSLISDILTYDPERKQYDHAIDALRYAVMGDKPNTESIQIMFGERP